MRIIVFKPRKGNMTLNRMLDNDHHQWKIYYAYIPL